MTRVARVERVEALLLEPVTRALTKWRGMDDIPAWKELGAGVAAGTHGVFVAGEGMTVHGFVLIYPELTKLMPFPFVAHLEVLPGAPGGTRALLVKACVDYIKSQGYTRFWATNVVGIPDELWMRTFRGAGNIERLGSVYGIEIVEDHADVTKLRKPEVKLKQQAGGHDARRVSRTSTTPRRHPGRVDGRFQR